MPAELVVLDPLASLTQDLLTPPAMFPGEDPALYEAMREALLRDLSPRSPYERLLANNLIELEWEAFRHRRFRDETIRTCAKDLAVGAFQTGKPRLVGRGSEDATALGQALPDPADGGA